MSSGPDLFVVCKNCRAEVSPYITECPYCGTRLRKRAPKLEKGGMPKAPRSARRKRPRPRLAPLRPGEMPGIRGESRPWAAMLLVLVAVGLSLALRIQTNDLVSGGLLQLALIGPPDGDWWQLVSTTFLYTNTSYEIVALGTIFLFGWLLERRHGWWAPLFVYLLAAAAGSALVVAVDDQPFTLGGNGAALGLLAAWSMRDLLGRRHGREDDADLLGVLAIALVLVLLPLAIEQAHSLAGLGGGLAGLVLGLILARVPER
jgi:membrane associated rhomboid family serine protease